MTIKTSILASSRHLTYKIAYDDSTCVRCHNYYINLDLCHHFISEVRYPLLVVTANFHLCAIPYLILVDGYVYVRVFHSRIFILCVYIVIDYLFSGIDLIHISTNRFFLYSSEINVVNDQRY